MTTAPPAFLGDAGTGTRIGPPKPNRGPARSMMISRYSFPIGYSAENDPGLIAVCRFAPGRRFVTRGQESARLRRSG